MSPSAYKVYRVEHRLGLQDPLMGPGTRYHNVLFVETDIDGGGRALQVEGSIGDVNGMTFKEEAGNKPEEAETYFRKYYLGEIRVSDYQNVVQLLQAIPPPPRQRTFNIDTKTTEQCKPDGTLYGAQEPRPPYMKCTEWTLQKAIPALEQSGLLHPSGIADNTEPMAQPTLLES